jgi:hypothetical protein
VSAPPSGSADPTELNDTTNGAFPVVGVPPATATGGWFASTDTDTVAVFTAPPSSVTVNDATKLPSDPYVCDGFACVDVPPSPNSHAYDTTVPSGSDDPAELNDTTNGAIPDDGDAPATATGGTFTCGSTVTDVDATPVAPALSVTVNVAVNVPLETYVCDGAGNVSTGLPSPKSHEYPTIVPSLSDEPAELNTTDNGAVPLDGVTPTTATGATFPPPAPGVVHPATNPNAPNTHANTQRRRRIGSPPVAVRSPARTDRRTLCQGSPWVNEIGAPETAFHGVRGSLR